MDLGPAYLKSVTAPGHAPQAIVCADVFHLVKLVGDALDEVRRDLWQQLRLLPGDRWAKDFKGARWALLKNPEDLTDDQAARLAKIKRNRGGIWRAYEMKEQFRAIFAGDLEPADAIEQDISNGRVEGLNTKVRLLVRRAYGFHSAEAALALVMLACGPINLKLPHEHQPQTVAA